MIDLPTPPRAVQSWMDQRRPGCTKRPRYPNGADGHISGSEVPARDGTPVAAGSAAIGTARVSRAPGLPSPTLQGNAQSNCDEASAGSGARRGYAHDQSKVLA